MNKKIYANILGTWVELKDTDTIYNTNPYTWIKENNLHDFTFIWIDYNGVGYKIHISHIQIKSM